MMNVFRSKKGAIKMQFHHEPMHILSFGVSALHQITLGLSSFLRAGSRVAIACPSQVMLIAPSACQRRILAFCALVLIVGLSGCANHKLIVIHSTTTVNCDPAKDECFSVSRGFLDEHGQLFQEVIRLREALDTCNKKLR